MSKHSSLVTSCHKSDKSDKSLSSSVQNKNIPGEKMMSAELIYKHIHGYDSWINQSWTIRKMIWWWR